ncbi:hypothetical protein J2X66_002398 [Pseudomonas sp. 3296]|uniref:hypothetical protein n=1 Tax=Pseudomonas sp. 3296 TaxID=2817753 RepID=UPI002866D4F1|nr:hypothetical protein [Pseudomonas sp. 3296]MDR6915530.1 hypothetical protein [Pseudomonas sp. 3296]
MKQNTTENLTSLNLILATFVLAYGTDAIAAKTLQIHMAKDVSSCEVIDINNYQRAVGNCTASNGAVIVWRSDDIGSVILPSLEQGQDCKVLGIGIDGTISGNCKEKNGLEFGTIWKPPYTVATKLEPLRSILQDQKNPDDVSSQAVAYNNSGFVVGQSLDKNGRATASMWTSIDAKNPMTVSTPRDNCQAVAINDQMAPDVPRVALNCSDDAGQGIARIAYRDLSGFIAVKVNAPPTYTSCQIRAVSNAGRYVGGCVSANKKTMATYWDWSNPEPHVLDLHNFTSSVVGVAVNNIGNIALDYRDLGGTPNPGYWHPQDIAINIVTAPKGQTYGRIKRISDNNVLLLRKENDGQKVVGDVVGSEPPEFTMVGGGEFGGVTAISPNGEFMAEIKY